MPKVRFKITRTVKDGTGMTFEKGKVYEMSEPSAVHWVNRGIAELAGPASKTSKPATVMETMAMSPGATATLPDGPAKQADDEESDAKFLRTDPNVTPPITTTSK